MPKDKLIGIIGNASKGKTTFSKAINQIIEKERGITIHTSFKNAPMIIESIEGIVERKRKMLQHHIPNLNSLINEYKLIQLKQSKLSHNKRKQVVNKIEKYLKDNVIHKNDLL